MRILVVDDEEGIRFTINHFLTEACHSVTTAQSFFQAVEELATNRFDLVFSDIILGGKTGIDLLRAIREIDADLPVVMITGHPTIETATEAVRLGALDYLQKPVTQEMVLKTVALAERFSAVQRERTRYQSNLEAIFRSVKDAIVTFDMNLRILEVNDKAAEICGATAKMRGMEFGDLSKRCGGGCLTSLQRGLREGRHVESFRVECRRRERPGQSVSITASPLMDGSGRQCGAILVARDETRLEVLERKLRERTRFHNLIGGSGKMQQLYAMIENLADVQSTVVIMSESGTGKELVAEALHCKGQRSGKPLIKVNCSALPENLLESELFGHVRGSFTGALKDKAGRFEMAGGGTIFLDEIGEISPAVQVKLLRVLQEREIERVGESTPRKVDVRIIAATNQDLAEKVRRGTFREDLYYRLNVVKLAIPPLRDRLEDLELLVTHFLNKFREKFRKPSLSISPEALARLSAHSWPGNVRELEHALEHASIMCSNQLISVENLPQEIGSSPTVPSAQAREQGICPEAIRQALEKTGGNKSKAAKMLGINRRTIYRKID